MNTWWIERNVNIRGRDVSDADRAAWRRLYAVDPRRASILALYGVLYYRIRKGNDDDFPHEEMVRAVDLFLKGVLYGLHPERPIFGDDLHATVPEIDVLADVDAHSVMMGS